MLADEKEIIVWKVIPGEGFSSRCDKSVNQFTYMAGNVNNLVNFHIFKKV